MTSPISSSSVQEFKPLEYDETRVAKGNFRGYIVCKKYKAEEAYRIRELYHKFLSEKIDVGTGAGTFILSSLFTVLCLVKQPQALIGAIPLNLYAINGYVTKACAMIDRLNELDALRDDHIESNGDDIAQATAKAAWYKIKSAGFDPVQYGIPKL